MPSLAFTLSHTTSSVVQQEIIDPKENQIPTQISTPQGTVTLRISPGSWHETPPRVHDASRPQPQTGTGPTYQPSKKQMQTPELSTHPTRKLYLPQSRWEIDSEKHEPWSSPTHMVVQKQMPLLTPHFMNNVLSLVYYYITMRLGLQVHWD